MKYLDLSKKSLIGILKPKKNNGRTSLSQDWQWGGDSRQNCKTPRYHVWLQPMLEISKKYGPGGMIMSLNRRLFALRRLSNHLDNKLIMTMVDGLFISKIRYGIQLMGKVRIKETDPTNKDFDNIQMVQNKLLRMLTKTKLKDMVSTKSRLNQTNMMSVNQINAQITKTG